MSIFKGVGVAIVTPFDEKGEINFKSYENLVKFQTDNKTSAIVVGGTTGEGATLKTQEKIELIKLTKQICGKEVKVIGGVSSNYTEELIEISKSIELSGADACLIVTPFYNKTTQKGLIKHYTAVANKISIPIILYNVPSRTGINIEPKTVYALSKIENIVGIKEASGNISQVAEICSLCEKNFYVYSGNDEQIIPMLSLGGKGVISVVANILPEKINYIVNKYLEGEVEKSLKTQLEIINLIKALFIEVNPIPIKTALNLRGMNAGTFRLPLVEMEEKNLSILREELSKFII